MSAFDFRSYMANLEKNNDLLRVSVEIDTLDDMGAFIARADYEGIDKPILFENPKGFDIPVLANTVGHTTKRMADAFGLPVENLLPNIAEQMMKVLHSGGVTPEYVDEGEAACREVIMKGEDVDLSKLPILRLNPEDGTGGSDYTEGRFITSVCITKPTPTSHNMSYHRFEITRKDGGSVWIFRGTGDALSMQNYWGADIDDAESTYKPDEGKSFPAAFVFGLTPEFIVGGSNRALPHEGDDFAYVGGIRNEAVKMVKCETIDVDVPANAEIVIEGEFKPFNWTTQGKFASFNGFYDIPRRRPVFDVTAITMRKKPIYQHVHIGRPHNECNSIAAFFRGVHVYREVKAVLPNVVDVFMDPSAGCGFTCHISIKKGRIGEPKMAIMRAYTALQGFCKHIFIYDEDINIHDSIERGWALAHRFIPDRDLMIVPNVMGMTIEPLAQGIMGKNSKLGVYDGYPEIPKNTRTLMGVDCTLPLGLEVMERVVAKLEIESRVDELWKAALG